MSFCGSCGRSAKELRVVPIAASPLRVCARCLRGEPEPEDCADCGGSGRCRRCDDTSSEGCDACGYEGNCPECEGRGYVLEEPAVPDAAAQLQVCLRGAA